MYIVAQVMVDVHMFTVADSTLVVCLLSSTFSFGCKPPYLALYMLRKSETALDVLCCFALLFV